MTQIIINNNVYLNDILLKINSNQKLDIDEFEYYKKHEQDLWV